jgi:hypothetical protein
MDFYLKRVFPTMDRTYFEVLLTLHWTPVKEELTGGGYYCLGAVLLRQVSRLEGHVRYVYMYFSGQGQSDSLDFY